MEQKTLNQDRRMYQRIGVGYNIRFSYGAEGDIMREARCVDVSAEGICFITEHEPALYKKIKIWVDIEDNKEPLQAEGKVIWKEETRLGMFRVGVNFDSVNLLEMGKLL